DTGQFREQRRLTADINVDRSEMTAGVNPVTQRLQQRALPFSGEEVVLVRRVRAEGELLASHQGGSVSGREVMVELDASPTAVVNHVGQKPSGFSPLLPQLLQRFKTGVQVRAILLHLRIQRQQRRVQVPVAQLL